MVYLLFFQAMRYCEALSFFVDEQTSSWNKTVISPCVTSRKIETLPSITLKAPPIVVNDYLEITVK